MIILGIETSCDETACAVVEAKSGKTKVLSNAISSQVKLHSKWGGVVPNLAAREHLKKMIPVLKLALGKAKVFPEQIDMIAVTQGPGLIPALLVGVDSAIILSYLWKKPLLGIHHVEGHIYANFINEIRAIFNNQFPLAGQSISKQIKNSKLKIKNYGIKFPILCLVVSGGHTQLILMKKHLNYEIIGETLDDAAGEAFDKVARTLKLGYPGGPAIARLAAKIKIKNSKPKANLPRPMISSGDFNFSFSGLKTAILYKVKKLKTINHQLKTELSYEFQQAVVDVLVSKTIKAAKKYKPATIMLAGGVSANAELRRQLGNKIKKEIPNTLYIMPTAFYSIDNAAMIAAAAYFRWSKMSSAQKKSSLANWKKIKADSNFKLA